MKYIVEIHGYPNGVRLGTVTAENLVEANEKVRRILKHKKFAGKSHLDVLVYDMSTIENLENYDNPPTKNEFNNKDDPGAMLRMLEDMF